MTGEKQDIFVPNSTAFDPLKTVLHHQGSPSSHPYLTGFAACTVFQIKSFTMIRDLKNKFFLGKPDFQVNRAGATSIGVEVDVGECLIDSTKNLSSIEVVEARVEGPSFRQIAQAMQPRRCELNIDQGFGGVGGLRHGDTVNRWGSVQERLYRS